MKRQCIQLFIRCVRRADEEDDDGDDVICFLRRTHTHTYIQMRTMRISLSCCAGISKKETGMHARTLEFSVKCRKRN